MNIEQASNLKFCRLTEQGNSGVTKLIDPTICIAGKNEIAVHALLELLDRGFEKNLVVCLNKTDSGESGWQPSLGRFAKEFGIPCVSLSELYEIDNLVFLSLEFDQLIRPESFKTNRLYNIHFSALPAFKGMYTAAIPILLGEKSSGVTLHIIDSGIDTGPIIAQKKFRILPSHSARDLYFLYLQNSKKLLSEQLDLILSEHAPRATPQSAIGSSYYSRKYIDYSNLTIDLNQTAEGITRQLRAYSFREFQTPEIHNIPVGTWQILGSRGCKPPGTILAEGPETITIATIDFDLQVWRDDSQAWLEWAKVSENTAPPPTTSQGIDLHNVDGWTPLIISAFNSSHENCRLLLESGAGVNTSNMNGTTPLMYAYAAPRSLKKQKTIELLLRFGANYHQKDRFGKKLSDYLDVSCATNAQEAGIYQE